MITDSRLRACAERLELGLGLLSGAPADEAFCRVIAPGNLAMGTCPVDGWRCFINLEHVEDNNVGIAQDVGYTIRVDHKQDGSPYGRIVLRNTETGCEWHVQI